MKGGCTVLILVANDLDALSACKILTSLLKQDNVQYSVIPVFSYQELQESASEEKVSEEFRSVVMLNCGALIDWTDFWLTDETKNVSTFIFDSHRPYQHNNEHTKKSIFLIDDGEVPRIDEIPDEEDLEMANRDSDSEAEEEEENFDPNTIGEEGEELQKRPRDDDDEIAKRRDLKRQRKVIAREYYEKNSTGKSISGVFYRLARDLNKSNPHFFWLSVLGLTDQYLHSRINQGQYEESHRE